MQYSTIGDFEISRFGVGTKSMPTEDSKRVIRLDFAAAAAIADKAVELGINYFDTSYSNHKGEAEAFLGEHFENAPREKHYTSTSFFEMVDPRYEYVFQKQMHKLKTDCIDFYHVEGVTDLMRMRDVDSGAVDFLFKQKEEGKVGLLGFSSELNPDNLAAHLDAYPWDFVRMRVNWFDWFVKGGRERYETAAEKGVPVIAHAAMHVGTRPELKPEARAALEAFDAERTQAEWALRFVASLDGIACVTCNMHSADEVAQNARVFNGKTVLGEDELTALEQAAQAQKTVIPHK